MTISITSLAERALQCGAKLILTSTDRAPLESASLKAVALAAVSTFVLTTCALSAIRQVLSEYKQLHGLGLDVEAVCGALKNSFREKIVIQSQEMCAKLEMLISMLPDWRLQVVRRDLLSPEMMGLRSGHRRMEGRSERVAV